MLTTLDQQPLTISGEALYQNILNSLPAPVVAVDLAGKIIAANRAWQQFEAESRGNHSDGEAGAATYFARMAAMGVAADSVAEIEAGVRAVGLGQQPQFQRECSCPLPAGPRWYFLIAAPLAAEAGAVVISHLNITPLISERTLAQESLWQFDESQNITRVGHWLWDGQRQMFEWSDQIYRILGVPPRAFPPSLEAFEAAIHPDDLPAFLSQREQIVQEKKDTIIEHRIILPAGEVRYVEERARVEADRWGNVRRVLGTVQDITERKLMEQALQESNERLQTALREIQQTQEKIGQQERLAVVGQLAAGIAHDFNNILTAILGHAGLAQLALPKEHPARPDIQGILTSAQRAGHITRQLLTFARSQISQPRSLNLNDLILAMAPMLRRLIGENIELTILPQPDLGWSCIDPHQFEQLLMNLVVNARDAMPRGGKLTIRTANAETVPPELPPGDYILLLVSDTGGSIAPELQPRIFEPFFTTKEAGQGTGLGLAICLSIVQQHEGQITVESEAGQGATFKVYLPRRQAHPEVDEAKTAYAPLPAGDETVLLVEDDPEVRDLALQILTAQGYTVLEAANGEEALRLNENWADIPIHLLLTDMVMPLVGGGELSEALRAKRPGLKVLLMSGYTDSDLIRPDRLSPDQGFLPKPFTIFTLTTQVRQLLDR